MKFQHAIKMSLLGSWGSLGYFRGINHYDYYNYRKTDSANPIPSAPIINFDRLIHGIFGMSLYLNPLFIPYTLIKEAHRIKIVIKGPEHEKKNKYYNTIA